METNEYILKLSGKANIPEALVMGNSYKIISDVDVVKSEVMNNQDNTINQIYTVKPITVTIEKDNGQTIKAKDPRNNSVKFRKSCFAVWSSKNLPGDEESWYDYATSRSIINLDAIADDYAKIN